MQKHSRLFQLPAGLMLLLGVLIGMGQMQPVGAHPYQEKSAESYQQEQAHWHEVIQREPKNPEAYLQLGASLTSEAAEGYWCTTRAIAVYRQAIASVPPNAEIHFRLGTHLVADPDVNCDEYTPTEIEARKKEGLLHLRQAIAIASEEASVNELLEAGTRLIQLKR